MVNPTKTNSIKKKAVDRATANGAVDSLTLVRGAQPQKISLCLVKVW